MTQFVNFFRRNSQKNSKKCSRAKKNHESNIHNRIFQTIWFEFFFKSINVLLTISFSTFEFLDINVALDKIETFWFFCEIVSSKIDEIGTYNFMQKLLTLQNLIFFNKQIRIILHLRYLKTQLILTLFLVRSQTSRCRLIQRENLTKI